MRWSEKRIQKLQLACMMTMAMGSIASVLVAVATLSTLRGSATGLELPLNMETPLGIAVILIILALVTIPATVLLSMKTKKQGRRR